MEEFDDKEAFCCEADADEILDIDDDDFTEEVIDDMNDVQLEKYDNGDNEPIRDDSLYMHREHKDEVFCVCFNPANSNIIASGGKDDKAVVWDLTARQTLFTCHGHNESIAALGFSSDGSLLATGDLNGLVKVWKVATGSEVWFFEVEEIQWLCWHHKATLLLAGTSDGNVWLWHVPFSHTKTLPSHGSSATCGSFMPDGKQACCGYQDGLVRIWDLKTTTFICSVDTNLKGSESQILCLDIHPKGNLAIAGSSDGSALLINAHNGQILFRYIHNNKVKENDNENDDTNRIESVAFSQLELCTNYVSTGNGRGEVNIWDVSSHTLRHSMHSHEADVIKIRWHPTLPLVLSASADGVVAIGDARSGEGVGELVGHEGAILDFEISKDGERLISCGEDHSVRIFNTSQ